MKIGLPLLAIALCLMAQAATAQEGLSAATESWRVKGSPNSGRWAYSEQADALVDLASVRRNAGYTTVWTWKAASENDKREEPTMATKKLLQTVDCAGRRLSIDGLVYYGEGALVIKSQERSIGADFYSVVPDTVGEGLLMFVCS